MQVFEFRSNMLKRMKRIAAMTNTSVSGMIRDALLLYDYLVQCRLRGEKIFIGTSREDSTGLTVTSIESMFE